MKFKNHTSIETLSISRFFEIIETSKHKLLFSVFTRLFISDEKALKTWLIIYDEYSERVSSNSSFMYYTLYNEIENLKVRYAYVYSAVMNLTEANKHLYVEELKRWQVIFNPKGNISAQMDTLKRQVRAIKSKLNRKVGDFETLNKKSNKAKSNIQKDLFELEHITHIKLDLKKNTIKEYLDLRDLANRIIKEKQKAVGNGKLN